MELEGLSMPEALRWDERSACFRAPASYYPAVLAELHRKQRPYLDEARAYQNLDLAPLRGPQARPYQQEALQAWLEKRGRGVVVLPTGAGKSHLALMAIAAKKRSTLVVAPTLDLVRQWHATLSRAFECEVGIIGGGEYNLQPLCVTTYDSAYLHMERFGARFGMLVFDECHHLPTESYALAASCSIAPFRLGLSATPERADGGEAAFPELIGDIVYRRDIVELSGSYLAEYAVQRIEVELNVDERLAYLRARECYQSFLRREGIRLASPSGWSQFLSHAARSREGREAFLAFREQRRLAFAASAKMDCVEALLAEHAGDRVIVFTEDNATAYAIARRCLAPIITHRSKIRERVELLRDFAEGRYGALITSKVLNEGVDVPSANVAIVVSGSGSVREHVQRLGRILRQAPGKRALLYELVTLATGETFTSERRRDHSAYR